MGVQTTEKVGGGAKNKRHARQSAKNRAARQVRRQQLTSEKNKILRNIRVYKKQPNNKQALAAAKRVLNDHPTLLSFVDKIEGCEVEVKGEGYSIKVTAVWNP